MADGLHHDVCAGAARQVQHLRDALLATLSDHVGGPPPSAEVGAVDVPAHQDDPFRSESLGGQHGRQPHGTVTDDTLCVNPSVRGAWWSPLAPRTLRVRPSCLKGR